MPDQVQDYFVDTVVDVSAANGVFRITFGQQEKNNSLRPVIRVLLPANQLGRCLTGISKAAGEIAQKIKESAPGVKGGEVAKAPEAKKKK